MAEKFSAAPMVEEGREVEEQRTEISVSSIRTKWGSNDPETDEVVAEVRDVADAERATNVVAIEAERAAAQNTVLIQACI